MKIPSPHLPPQGACESPAQAMVAARVLPQDGSRKVMRFTTEYEKETTKMKPLILTILAAVSLMAAQNTPAPATSAPATSPATPKTASSAPAATSGTDTQKPVKRHHKKNVTGTPAASTNNSGKPAASDSSKPAAPPSK
jgi:hypothetical protein